MRSPEDLGSPENCPLVSPGGPVDTHASGCNHGEESARGLEEDPCQGQPLGLASRVEGGPQKCALDSRVELSGLFNKGKLRPRKPKSLPVSPRPESVS